MNNIKHGVFAANRPIDILHNVKPEAENALHCLVILIDKNDQLQVWGSDFDHGDLCRMAVKLNHLALAAEANDESI